MRDDARVAIVSRLAEYTSAIEVGIGTRTEVAAALTDCDISVTATDIHDRSVPSEVDFLRDDLTDPAIDRYPDAAVVYSCNLPPELHRPARDLARQLDADLVFTTLGADPPTVDVRPETIPGETLFWATERGEHRVASRKSNEQDGEHPRPSNAE